MSHLVIAIVGSLAVVALAAVTRVPTYRVAPAFLIPAVWALFFLRRRLHLRPLHYALIVSAIVLHMLGALGYYQGWPLPVSFDVVVHYWFALVVALAIHHLLAAGYPLLRPWHAYVLAFFIVMGLASAHEVMEYGSYLLLGEERGMLKPSTSYFFDTSRDLTSNLFGTLTALAAVAVTRGGFARRSETNAAPLVPSPGLRRAQSSRTPGEG
jgi:uncharacterized membrane protein YjdF